MKKETIIRADYREVEKLINKTYGIDYSIVECEELGNDSTVSFNNINGEIESEEEHELEETILGNNMYRTHLLLNDLCRKGLIEAGNYVIDVRW